MARSVWKGPFVELSLLKKAEAAQDKGARTRHNKATDKMIIRSRHAKKKR